MRPGRKLKGIKVENVSSRVKMESKIFVGCSDYFFGIDRCKASELQLFYSSDSE